MQNSIPKFPPVIFVMETQALPGNFVERALTLERREHEHFESVWQSLQAHVVAQVRTDSLQRISRWAKAEMKTLVLPSDWPKQMPLRPSASTAENRMVRFGQFKEEGYPLPSHHPLVFRRLLLCVDYDRGEQRITQVIVTINGWVEE